MIEPVPASTVNVHRSLGASIIRRVSAAQYLGRALFCALAWTLPSAALGIDDGDIRRRLLAAYPNAIADIKDGEVIFRDAKRLPFDDGRVRTSSSDWLASPSIKDMFRYDYPAGGPLQAPPIDYDPGRARNAAFFQKLYGNCERGDVSKHLVDVVWLPSESTKHVRVTSRHGVADRVRQISAELDALPHELKRYVTELAGGYVCRHIAGTTQTSAHGYGIAIDIALQHAHYWRWDAAPKQGTAATSPIAYRNAIPARIVEIFERHGFAWGGRWYHYDTMHFEYRPELFERIEPLQAP